jgi:hypothetical protein
MEKDKIRFAKLKRIMGKSQSGPMDHILVEDTDGTYIRIQNPEEMHKAILLRNYKHFR